jgi:hypothetical protein
MEEAEIVSAVTSSNAELTHLGDDLIDDVRCLGIT